MRKRNWCKYNQDLAVLKKEFFNTALFGFKDPRTARNISLWKEIFFSLPNTEVQLVIIFRNPVSVAQSLHSRNKIDPVRSYYLWLQYNISALLAADDFDTHFISYENLVQNPFSEMKHLGESLGLHLSSEIESQLTSFAENYVDLSMQHHQNCTEDISSQKDLPFEVNLLYESYLDSTLDESSKIKLLALTHEINQRLREMDPLLKMIDISEGIGESREHRFFELVEQLIPRSATNFSL